MKFILLLVYIIMSSEIELSENNLSIIREDEDHKPHQLFCEMDELRSNFEWKEAARWLKFEENVENAGRWSKPHVASLSLRSLLDLRSCLTNGAILLDFKGEDINTIINCLLDKVIRLKYLDESKRELVKNTLLLKHLHQHEKEFQKRVKRGDKKSFSIIKTLTDLTKKKSNPQTQGVSIGNNILAANGSKPNFDLNGSQEMKKIDSKSKMNQNFMRKIPIGAEAFNILLGEVDYLSHRFTAFVRLSKSLVLDDFTEVPVPTKFLFILLGPKGNMDKYREIGRSISTWMSDEIFHEIAYKAKNRQEILIGFDGFLDQVTVLPPGEWDPNIRLKPPSNIPQKKERLEKMKADLKKLNTPVEESDLEVDANETDSGLEFTGKFCGGLICDIKRKLPWYWSDFKDGFNFQCLSSIMFMYFACLSSIITYGGLLAAATDQNMSAIESLVSGLISGVLYSLFSGQPMSIISSTGSVLVFENIINTFSKENGIDYMGFRAWIGLWTGFMSILIAVTDCSVLVKYITRFTEESFAFLIALIFIIESVDKLIGISKFSNDPMTYINEYRNDTQCLRCIYFGKNSSMTFNSAFEFMNEKQCKDMGPSFLFMKNCKNSPDVFFFSVLLFIFTFCFTMMIRLFRTSRFFPTTIRCKIADFGVLITIVSAVLIDWYFAFNTPKLIVPLKFETTIPTRGWFINPLTRNSDKLWLCPLAILPAILATILIFMDQHIPSVIINRKENKLKKGGGYHLDFLIIGISICINSLLGIPWFVAATVLSINHVLCLKKQSDEAAPGENPKFFGVIEQRLTNIVVSLMIGLSVFLANFLRMIPMPVLYGIFLYMSITSLSGNQFMNRIALIFMPEKHQPDGPDYIYLRYVRSFKVHLFTLIQIASILMLFAVKSNKTISITFPIMVLALVGVRKIMDYFFTQKELSHLDDIMPEIIKREKENEIEDLKDNLNLNKSESIDITYELSKTQIWLELVKKNDIKPSSSKKGSINRNRKNRSTLNSVENEDLSLVNSNFSLTSRPKSSIVSKKSENDDQRLKISF